MRFYGSAMRVPHVQGAFRENLIVEESQCVPVPSDVSTRAAAFCEPLSCGLHALNRAGGVLGKRVLVTGQGPIGSLAALAALACGAAEVVATDIVDEALTTVMSAAPGAPLKTINVASNAMQLDAYADNKGYFDVLIEASGNSAALEQAIAVVRPRAVIVQLGIGENAPLPLSAIVAKELEIRGTFRFHSEFEVAASLIASKRINVEALLTAVLPLADANEAFALASDRKRSMKVQLELGQE